MPPIRLREQAKAYFNNIQQSGLFMGGQKIWFVNAGGGEVIHRHTFTDFQEFTAGNLVAPWNHLPGTPLAALWGFSDDAGDIVLRQSQTSPASDTGAYTAGPGPAYQDIDIYMEGSTSFNNNSSLEWLIIPADNIELGNRYRLDIHPGTNVLRLREWDGPSNVYTVRSSYTLPFVVGVNTIVCTRTHYDGSTVQSKAWLKGTEEPATWQLVWSDTDVPVPAPFYAGVHNYSARAAPTIYAFGVGIDGTPAPKEPIVVAEPEVPVEPVAANNVIIVTDYAGDCDDAVALALACKAHTDGLVNIIGIIVSSSIETSAPGVYGQLNAYGLAATIPVYAYQGALGTYNNRLSIQVRDEHGIPGQTRSAYQDDVTGFRTLLASVPDASVKVIDIGAPVSTARLLDSPADAISPLTGVELVAAKVVGLWGMAGRFDSAVSEYNMTRDIPSSQKVYADWPTPIIAHGYEVGQPVYTGPAPGTVYGVDPVKTAFDAFASYSGPLQSGKRNSWDPITVHHAIWGDQTYYNLAGSNGTITVDSSGISRFTTTANDHAYVGKVASNADIATAIEALTHAYIVAAEEPVYSPNQYIFSMNEGAGTTLMDGAGTNSFIMPDAGASWAADPTHVLFDGISGRLRWDSLDTNFLVNDFVVGVIARQTDQTLTQQFAAISDSTDKIFQLRSNAGALEYVSFAGASGSVETSGYTIPLNTWIMPLVYVRSGAVDIRANGVALATQTFSSRNTTLNNERRLYLGARAGTSGAGVDFLRGGIAGFVIRPNAVAADVADVETELRQIATNKGITLP